MQDGVTRSRARPSTRSLPEWALAPDASIFLNIPMDAETPRWEGDKPMHCGARWRARSGKLLPLIKQTTT